MTQALSYCGEHVKKHDPDRFLLSMFVPAERREALWALFAFNHEIAKTREVVSETQLGLIRLQWWREAIEKIYNGEESLENEILPSLAKAIKAYDLPREHFDTLIYAREFDLEDVLPGNLEGLLNYTDFTHTPLVKLAVQVTEDNAEQEPVQAIAMNYALVGLLRAVPFHASRGRCYLPEDLLKNHDVYLNQLYHGKTQDGLPAVIRSVADEIVMDIKPESRFLRVMHKLTKIYARQLKSAKYDVFSPKLQLPPALKVLRLIF